MVSLNMRTRAVGLDRWELSAPTVRVSITVLRGLFKDGFLASNPFKRDCFYPQFGNKKFRVLSLRNQRIFRRFYRGTLLSFALSKYLIIRLPVTGGLDKAHHCDNCCIKFYRHFPVQIQCYEFNQAHKCRCCEPESGGANTNSMSPIFVTLLINTKQLY